VKRNLLERMSVAAKVANFRLFLFSAWQALFVFLFFFLFVSTIGALPPRTFSPFFFQSRLELLS
jgi:hypothetical protein